MRGTHAVRVDDHRPESVEPERLVELELGGLHIRRRRQRKGGVLGVLGALGALGALLLPVLLVWLFF